MRARARAGTSASPVAPRSVFADGELCCYVKVEALALPGTPRAPGLARFELVVRDVLEDRAEGEEAGARLASGLTIAWPGDPAASRGASLACARRSGSDGRHGPDALLHSDDVECLDGLQEALEGQGPDRLEVDRILGGAGHARRDQDLARLGLAAQARRQVRDRADGAVVPAALEADGADGRVALGDADAEAEVVPALAPGGGKVADLVAHRDGHPQGALGRPVHRQGIVEEDHHAVAGEPLQRALVLEDQPAHGGVVLAEDPHDLLGLGRLREGGEPAEVEEDDRDLAAMGLQGGRRRPRPR